MLEGTLRVLRCIQGVRLFANLCKFIEEMLNIFFFFCQSYTFGNSRMGGGHYLPLPSRSRISGRVEEFRLSISVLNCFINNGFKMIV